MRTSIRQQLSALTSCDESPPPDSLQWIQLRWQNHDWRGTFCSQQCLNNKLPWTESNPSIRRRLFPSGGLTSAETSRQCISLEAKRLCL